jgi:hypothetical protein
MATLKRMLARLLRFVITAIIIASIAVLSIHVKPMLISLMTVIIDITHSLKAKVALKTKMDVLTVCCWRVVTTRTSVSGMDALTVYGVCPFGALV